MNLLCINYEYPPIGGGGGVVCQGLAEALAHKGYSIDLVTSGIRGLPVFERRNGVKIHRIRCIRRHKHYVTLPEMLTSLIPMYLKALSLTRHKSYDLNHTHFIFPSGVVSYLLKKQTGLPYIITCHGSDVPGYNPDRFHLSHKVFHFAWKRVVRDSYGLSTPSDFLKRLIQSQIDMPVDVIPNGYNLPELNMESKKNRILVVTRMFERKGVQFFIEAVENLTTDWEILIAGDGPYLTNLKSLAKNIPSINFLGFVKGQALIDLYESSKIFVFPSLQENFPVVLLEAMSYGCAIITSKAAGCAEVVRSAAIQTECGSVSEIRDALENLIENQGKMRRLARLARNRAREFAWSNVSRHFDELSKRCLRTTTG